MLYSGRGRLRLFFSELFWFLLGVAVVSLLSYLAAAALMSQLYLADGLFSLRLILLRLLADLASSGVLFFFAVWAGKTFHALGCGVLYTFVMQQTPARNLALLSGNPLVAAYDIRYWTEAMLWQTAAKFSLWLAVPCIAAAVIFVSRDLK